MIVDYFKLAFNNLRRKKLRSWLTILGVLIGITAVVSLIGLGEGLETAISSQFGISVTNVLTIQAGGVSGAGPPGTGVVNPLTLDDAEDIERLSSIERVIPRVIQAGRLEFNDRLIFGSALNVPDGADRDFVYESLNIDAEFGRLLKDSDVGKVVLGYNFYDNKVGLNKPVLVGNTVLIQNKKFEVVGITEKKGSFIFDNIVYMQDAELYDLFELDGDVDVLVAQVKNTQYMQQAKEDVEKILRKNRDVDIGEEDFSVQTPEQALSTLNDVLLGVKIFVLVIASISIFIGVFGIVNTMLTSVVERKSEIGIMKAIGARNSDIFYLFFIESGFMGLVGGIIGSILGTIIAFTGTLSINEFFGSTAHVSINIMLILLTLVSSFVIGAISGIAPALKAAKQNPVDAIRG